MRGDPFEALLRWGARVPEPFGEWTPGRSFVAIRSRLNLTQEEVGLLAGITQSQVSRVEGDGNARISTWKRLYAAMGFELLLLPRARQGRRGLERRADQAKPPGAYLKQRASPRPRGGRNLRRRAAGET